MWEFMSSRPHVLATSTREGIMRVRESKGKYAFLIESSTNEYTNERAPCDTIKVQLNIVNTVSRGSRKLIREKFSAPSYQTKYAS